MRALSCSWAIEGETGEMELSSRWWLQVTLLRRKKKKKEEKKKKKTTDTQAYCQSVQCKSNISFDDSLPNCAYQHAILLYVKFVVCLYSWRILNIYKLLFILNIFLLQVREKKCTAAEKVSFPARLKLIPYPLPYPHYLSLSPHPITIL